MDLSQTVPAAHAWPASAGTVRSEAYFTAPGLAPTHSAYRVPTELSSPTATKDTGIPAATPLREADNWAASLSQNLSLCCMATYLVIKSIFLLISNIESQSIKIVSQWRILTWLRQKSKHIS